MSQDVMANVSSADEASRISSSAEDKLLTVQPATEGGFVRSHDRHPDTGKMSASEDCFDPCKHVAMKVFCIGM